MLRACTRAHAAKRHNLNGTRDSFSRLSPGNLMDGILTMALAVFVRRFAPTLCAGILFSIVSTNAFADERCAQLIALDKEYRGVTLTEEQKAIKVQLVSWYRANCGRSRLSARRE